MATIIGRPIARLSFWQLADRDLSSCRKWASGRLTRSRCTGSSRLRLRHVDRLSIATSDHECRGDASRRNASLNWCLVPGEQHGSFESSRCDVCEAVVVYRGRSLSWPRRRLRIPRGRM